MYAPDMIVNIILWGYGVRWIVVVVL